jgi:hypothetical protein
MRLKRIGADARQAIRLLIDLVELQELRLERLADLRLRMRSEDRMRR